MSQAIIDAQAKLIESQDRHIKLLEQNVALLKELETTLRATIAIYERNPMLDASNARTAWPTCGRCGMSLEYDLSHDCRGAADADQT